MKKFIPMIAVIFFSGALFAQKAAGSELTVKIYEFHWLRPDQAIQLLPMMEPPGYSRINDTLKVITVRATESEHRMVSELLARFDIAPSELEFQFYLLRATRGESGIKNGVPESIKKVLEEVGTLTRYTHFELVDTPTLRFQEGRNAELSGKGVYYYAIEVSNVAVIKTNDPATIQVDNFRINFAIPITDPDLLGEKKVAAVRDVGVRTSFTVKDQETIVIGASQIRPDPDSEDTAIITILKANVR
jgi:hypothetical protein